MADEVDRAVLVELDHSAGVCQQEGPAVTAVGHGGHAYTALLRARAALVLPVLFLPADCLGASLDAVFEIGALEGQSAHVGRLAGLLGVLERDLDRIESELHRSLMHELIDSPHDLGVAEAAHSAGERGVGVDDLERPVDVVAAVMAHAPYQRDATGQHGTAQVSACPGHRVDSQRVQGSVLLHAQLAGDVVRRPGVDIAEVLFLGVDYLDRLAGHLGEHDGDGLVVAAQPAAEAPAHEGGAVHGDHARAYAEHLCQLTPEGVCQLAGAVDRDPAVGIVVGNAALGFELADDLLHGEEGALDDHVGLLEAFVHVALFQKRRAGA